MLEIKKNLLFVLAITNAIFVVGFLYNKWKIHNHSDGDTIVAFSILYHCLYKLDTYERKKHVVCIVSVIKPMVDAKCGMPVLVTWTLIVCCTCISMA